MTMRFTIKRRINGSERSILLVNLGQVIKKPTSVLNLVSISEDKQTGLISVSVEHESPDIAKQWVELMVSRVSEDLRSKDIREAEESIKFLEAQREKTSLVSLDEVFAQLIEEQTKTIMLANVSKDYVFDVIDPPVAPELKSKPSRALICVLGTLFGGMLGVVVVLDSTLWKTRIRIRIPFWSDRDVALVQLGEVRSSLVVLVRKQDWLDGRTVMSQGSLHQMVYRAVRRSCWRYWLVLVWVQLASWLWP